MPMPPAPERTFASDNAAPAHPDVIEEIRRANHGHALAYGADEWTADVERSFDEIFGRRVSTSLVVNGTGANVLALATILEPGAAVICTDWSHVATDEAAAPERILGTKLIAVPSESGRMHPDRIREQARNLGNIHHAQAGVVSITQATEWGTLYTIDEIGDICEVAHANSMTVHLDGARLANAVAAHGGSVDVLRAMVVETGVDVVSFGGTKNGLLGAEAVIHLDPDRARRAAYLRKQVNQLTSKMRFIAAQFTVALRDDNWIRWATNANASATALHAATAELLGADAPPPPPAVNSVFPVLDPTVAGRLREWSFFWPWDLERNQYRWMTAWDTTGEDISRFTAGLAHVLGHPERN